MHPNTTAENEDQNQNPVEELLNLSEVAAILRLSYKQVWRLCKKGLLSYIQPQKGGSILVSRRDLESFLKRYTR